jgi:hypothetical protein
MPRDCAFSWTLTQLFLSDQAFMKRAFDDCGNPRGNACSLPVSLLPSCEDQDYERSQFLRRCDTTGKLIDAMAAAVIASV